MTGDVAQGNRILGTLAAEDGHGVIRIEDLFDTNIKDLWTALTDPRRLERWYATVEGDLRVGGTYHSKVHASGWEGDGRIEACEAPHRFVVTAKEPDDPYEITTEVTLAAEGDKTRFVMLKYGMPLDKVAAYGAGNQLHVEDLISYIAGKEPVDSEARWDELQPFYDDMAAKLKP